MANSAGVGREKWAALEALMLRVGVVEADLEEKFVRASGPGGQKVNKTSSAVYLRHSKTGIEIKAQTSRSQASNRYFARLRLAERLLLEIEGKQSAQVAKIEKVRRQKRKRSKRAKNKMLDAKKQQGDKKKGRRPPGASD